MKDSFDYVVIGAGISGIVISERLANLNNKKILIIDKRDHIGGNAYDFFNADGVLVHKYGPHIFHTSKEMVYKYLSAFTKWTPYKHKVVANVNNKLLPIPINRDTINGFFDLDLKNEQDVKQFLDKKRDTTILSIKNSKDVILSKYGEELYDGFIKNYTKKQWDLYPEELDKKVLERIPVRYDSNPYYFDDKYQCMPESGYTHMFNKMLESKNITVLLKTDYKDVVRNLKYKALIVTSAVDEFFNYKLGRLRYRCVDFKFKTWCG